MSNLLEETIGAISAAEKTPADIIFIGSQESGHRCTWDEFCKLADIEYDSGYGGAEIATDLIIVFKDGTKLERGEYDGSEWWEYRKAFVFPDKSYPITNLKGDLWEKLEETSK